MPLEQQMRRVVQQPRVDQVRQQGELGALHVQLEQHRRRPVYLRVACVRFLVVPSALFLAATVARKAAVA